MGVAPAEEYGAVVTRRPPPSKRLERRPSGIGLPRYVACYGLRSHRLVEADNAGYKKASNRALERPVMGGWLCAAGAWGQRAPAALARWHRAAAQCRALQDHRNALQFHVRR
jgi:hypothetical protein